MVKKQAWSIKNYRYVGDVSHVMWAENNFTADAVQNLTNNLCYTQVLTCPPVFTFWNNQSTSPP
jgi:hypothetical protein